MSNADKVERLRTKATQLHAAGQLAEAEQLYRRILELRRDDLTTRYMIGVVKLQQGFAAEALALLEPLIAQAPANADIRTQCGLARQELGDLKQAMANFDLVLAQTPGNALTLLYRGNLLTEMKTYDRALSDYQRLLQIAPGYDEAWFRLGVALWRLERFEDALASYSRASDLNPGRFSAVFNQGTILLRLERYDEALAAFEAAGKLAPNHPYLLGSLISAVEGGCDFRRWHEIQSLAVAAVSDGRAAIAPLAFMPLSDNGMLRRRCSENFVASRVPRAERDIWNGERYNHDRIRIAYLSGDFRQHATADLIAGLIERHDRARFEITAISFGSDDGSPMRARLIQAFDRFDDVRLQSDAEVARLLRDGQYDIAVDLKGHTDESRPGILAHRPCPVQVNYLGYPGTIGAPWLDYIIADADVLPLEHEAFYSEKIVHLPRCYQVNDRARPIAQTPTRGGAGLPDSGFIFCCFNAAWKITPAMFDIWLRLLSAAPESLLWLLADNETAQSNLRAAAAAKGVDPARLIFAPKIPAPDHLARHRLADLFLDTLPYNAHTTASDALWAGLPLLTCLGGQFDGRVAASLLRAVGLDELIAHDLGAYEAMALALAQDAPRLADLRTRLAENRLTSPLFDTEGFCKDIEAAYSRMVEISRAGRKPESLVFPA
jgi:predicted O-linked N-acetylglucosamine transferase (SPINDLY family)